MLPGGRGCGNSFAGKRSQGKDGTRPRAVNGVFGFNIAVRRQCLSPFLCAQGVLVCRGPGPSFPFLYRYIRRRGNAEGNRCAEKGKGSLLKLRRKFTRGRGREGRKEGRKEGLCLRRAQFPVLDGVGKFLRRPSGSRGPASLPVCVCPTIISQAAKQEEGWKGRKTVIEFSLFLPLKDRPGGALRP